MWTIKINFTHLCFNAATRKKKLKIFVKTQKNVFSLPEDKKLDKIKMNGTVKKKKSGNAPK